MPENKYALTTLVRPEEDGLMVKEIVYGRLNLSRGLLRRMKRGGGIYLNGRRDFLTRRVRAGDEIRIHFYDEPTEMPAENIPLNIVYEDDFLLVINKPAGMSVHPAGQYQSGTLANGLAYYWQQIGLETKVRLVHRIDRDTSGLILVAKEPYTLQRLLEQIKDNTLVREYLAVVEGRPETIKGTIEAPIGRSLDHGVKRAVRSEGKKSITSYELLAGNERVSLLRVRLRSGRTHQIRVHLASIGNPLLGDPLYNAPSGKIDGQALHAWRLEFRHPRTEQQHIITCPLPPAILEAWKTNYRGG